MNEHYGVFGRFVSNKKKINFCRFSTIPEKKMVEFVFELFDLSRSHRIFLVTEL